MCLGSGLGLQKLGMKESPRVQLLFSAPSQWSEVGVSAPCGSGQPRLSAFFFLWKLEVSSHPCENQ